MTGDVQPTGELFRASSEALWSEHDHPEIVAPWDPRRIHASAAVELLELLCDMVADGTRFGVGETIQWGYRAIHLRAGEEIGEPGKLALFEPRLSVGPEDRVVDPDELVPGVTTTLLTVAAQRGVAASFGLPLRLADTPSQRDSIEYCDRVTVASEIILVRTEPHEGHSGWFVGCRDDDHDHLAERHVASCWDVVRERPGMVSFLALPVGCMVVLRADESVAACDADDVDLDIAGGSYLARFGARSPYELPDPLP